MRPKVNRDRVSIAIDRTFGRASGGRHNEVSCHAEEKGRRRCGSKGREREREIKRKIKGTRKRERETVASRWEGRAFVMGRKKTKRSKKMRLLSVACTLLSSCSLAGPPRIYREQIKRSTYIYDLNSTIRHGGEGERRDPTVFGECRIVSVCFVFPDHKQFHMSNPENLFFIE